MPPSAKKKKWLGKLLGFGLLGFLLLALVGIFVLREWLNHYLGSEAFRTLLAERIGRAAHAECTLDPLTWSAGGVYTPSVTLKPAGGQAWKSIEADGVQATVDLSTARSGVWSIPSINLDSVHMLTQPGSSVTEQKPLPTDSEAEKNSMPGWLQRFLPQRTEISEVKVQEFEIKPAQGSGVALSGLKVTAKPAGDEGTWLLRSSDGTLTLPGLTTPFRLNSASATVNAGSLTLNDAVSRWLGDSEVTGRGELPFNGSKPWNFSGHLSGLDLKEVLSGEWNTRLSGMLEGEYEAVSAPPGDVRLKGKLSLKNGVVQRLAVLDRVADFTHTERFRRVVLDEAKWDIDRIHDTTNITNLVLQSNGLIRVEGAMVIKGRNIQGDFLVGVSPQTLRWMPGAQAHVFTQAHPSGAPGFVWTRVKMAGNLDTGLHEDLSNRLLAAMGRALIDEPLDVALKGVDLLGKAGIDVVGKTGNTVIEGGKGLIEGAGDAASKGVDVIKGFVPFLK